MMERLELWRTSHGFLTSKSSRRQYLVCKAILTHKDSIAQHNPHLPDLAPSNLTVIPKVRIVYRGKDVFNLWKR